MNTIDEKKVKEELPSIDEEVILLLQDIYDTYNKIENPLDTQLKETWPLYVIFGDTGNYHDDALKLIKEWNYLSEEIDTWIEPYMSNPLMTKALEKNQLFKFYNSKKFYFESISGRLSGTTLERINGKPTGFIHKDIEIFYKNFNESKYAGKDDSKENTGDVVLLYGCSPEDVYSALKENRVMAVDNSLSEIADNQSKPTGKKFAIVSLKAGEGRVGKVLKYLGSEIEIPSATPSLRNPQKLGPEDFKNEIFNDIFIEKSLLNEIEFFNALRSNLTRIISKVGNLPDLIKNLWEDFTRKIKALTSKLYNILLTSISQDTKVIAAKYNNLITLQEKIKSETLLNEKKDGPVEISHTLYTNVRYFVNEVEKINFHSLFGDIIQKSQTLNENNIYQIDIEGIDETSIQNIKNEIINDIWKNHFYNKIHNQMCSTKKVSCDPAVYVERTIFQPMLLFNSNIIAMEFFQSFLNRIISQSGGLSEQKRIREEFIKLAASISAEAIFGKNEKLPLIKFTGKEILRLGKKEEYSTGKSLNEYDRDFKLGRFRIKKIDNGNYFVIYMYVLFDIKIEDDQVVPYYSQLELRSDSGSKFAFKAEINKTNISKDEVFK